MKLMFIGRRETTERGPFQLFLIVDRGQQFVYPYGLFVLKLNAPSPASREPFLKE